MTDAKTIDDGGPAFPTPISKGISIRDYFAAAALPAIIRQCVDDLSRSNPDKLTREQHFARMAYGCADAMLEARKRSAE